MIYSSKELPTGKQISFATIISEALNRPLPQDYTKQTYSKFISDNLKDFVEWQRCDGAYDYDDEWDYEYCDLIDGF